MGVCYHFIKTSHNGTGYQDQLDSIQGKPFGKQGAIDKTGSWICIDCKSSKKIGTEDGEWDELNDFIGDYPQWMLDIDPHPENCSKKKAKEIVRNSNWCPE